MRAASSEMMVIYISTLILECGLLQISLALKVFVPVVFSFVVILVNKIGVMIEMDGVLEHGIGVEYI